MKKNWIKDVNTLIKRMFHKQPLGWPQQYSIDAVLLDYLPVNELEYE